MNEFLLASEMLGIPAVLAYDEPADTAVAEPLLPNGPTVRAEPRRLAFCQRYSPGRPSLCPGLCRRERIPPDSHQRAIHRPCYR